MRTPTRVPSLRAARSRREPRSLLLGAALVLALAPDPLCAQERSEGERVWRGGHGAWREDPIWYDGLAEKCVYDAALTLYGEPRAYTATAYTNKQRQDPETTAKSSDDTKGLIVFKHHWSERVPTENYDYDFSTASFVAADTLEPFKLAVGTQEDCGASYKQAVRAGAELAWTEAVYHPGGGLRQGRVTLAGSVHFEDALCLVLRDYPFEAARTLEFGLIPSQKSTQRVPFETRAARVHLVGTAELELPCGRLRAHELALEVDGEPRAKYWFAADCAPPLLHMLVQYEGPGGSAYRLRSHERTAYWQR